ncbi:MAG: thermonuclease family protein [Phycisphaerae bacterium]
MPPGRPQPEDRSSLDLHADSLSDGLKALIGDAGVYHIGDLSYLKIDATARRPSTDPRRWVIFKVYNKVGKLTDSWSTEEAVSTFDGPVESSFCPTRVTVEYLYPDLAAEVKAMEDSFVPMGPPRNISARRFLIRKVVDGETIVIKYDGQPTRVRLLGYDAPEPGQPGSREATEKLKTVLAAADNVVELEFAKPRRDPHGYLLASAYLWTRHRRDRWTRVPLNSRL